MYSTLHYLYTYYLNSINTTLVIYITSSLIYFTQSIAHPLITLCTTRCCFTLCLSNCLRPSTVHFKHYKSTHILSPLSFSFSIKLINIILELNSGIERLTTLLSLSRRIWYNLRTVKLTIISCE